MREGQAVNAPLVAAASASITVASVTGSASFGGGTRRAPTYPEARGRFDVASVAASVMKADSTTPPHSRIGTSG